MYTTNRLLIMNRLGRAMLESGEDPADVLRSVSPELTDGDILVCAMCRARCKDPLDGPCIMASNIAAISKRLGISTGPLLIRSRPEPTRAQLCAEARQVYRELIKRVRQEVTL